MHDIRPYLPDLFTQPGSLLYIGARPDARSCTGLGYEVRMDGWGSEAGSEVVAWKWVGQ